mgnify:CR=1 FL=1
MTPPWQRARIRAHPRRASSSSIRTLPLAWLAWRGGYRASAAGRHRARWAKICVGNANWLDPTLTCLVGAVGWLGDGHGEDRRGRQQLGTRYARRAFGAARRRPRRRGEGVTYRSGEGVVRQLRCGSLLLLCGAAFVGSCRLRTSMKCSTSIATHQRQSSRNSAAFIMRAAMRRRGETHKSCGDTNNRERDLI